MICPPDFVLDGQAVKVYRLKKGSLWFETVFEGLV